MDVKIITVGLAGFARSGHCPNGALKHYAQLKSCTFAECTHRTDLHSIPKFYAEVNSLVPVQALDSGVLSYLATVVSPVSSASPGAAVLQAKLIKDDGSELAEEINMGDIKLLPLEPGENARLQLRPVQRADVGLGPGRAGEVDVSGSALGIVLDGRGRPLRLAADTAQRCALAQKWLASLEG